MRSFTTYFLGFGIAISLFIFIAIPDKNSFYKMIEVILLLSSISFILIPRYIRFSKRHNQKLNLGLIFCLAMMVIMLFGNISNTIIKFIYPGFDDFMFTTNVYWSVGLFFFSIGYFINIKNKRKVSRARTVYPVKLKYVYLLTAIAFAGVFASYVTLGFIPFLGGVGTGERYTDVGSTSLYIRLWSSCVISAIFALNYYIANKKSNIALFLLISSILISLFFLIRMYPFLIFVTIFLYVFSITENKKSIYINSIIFGLLYFFINAVFSEYREQDLSANEITEDQSLNIIQRKVFYKTFNEYGQLNTLINSYNAEPQYGKTLLSIPVGFIPAPILEPFGIIKSEIQSNNSGALFAKFLESKTSTGIRVGILGEFFINFKLFGCLFMFFIGMVIGMLQTKINSLDSFDWRFGYYLVFFVIFLYSLIGQIDAIGSLLGNYFILFMLIIFFIKRFRTI